LTLASSAVADSRATFAIDYIVAIAADDPTVAHVRWELSGIDEIDDLRLRFAPDRFEGFSGSGSLERSEGFVRWVPGAPYAHLRYRVRIARRRGTPPRYDSYANRDWIVTRARDLFPRITLNYTPRAKQVPKSRARLRFELPRGWRSASLYPALKEHEYLLNEPGRVLDRPRGWVALGKVETSHREIAGTMVEVVRAPGSQLRSNELFRLYEATLPAVQKLCGRVAERLLVVSAPDPMWHGGISARDSFYIHGDRPLRTRDMTSPYLHELFHVMQPYTPAADADWIEEGLAEFYSLELQRRAGLIDAAEFQRALEYFERFGLWRVDLTKQHDNAATNNSAPLVMHAIDQRILRATVGARRLDDVVKHLAARTRVDTAAFRHVVETVAGRNFSVFFRRYVSEGKPPPLGGKLPE
jgi:predicted metalloprotease with PDZ domain